MLRPDQRAQELAHENGAPLALDDDARHVARVDGQQVLRERALAWK
jgi:hypothetical protein